MNGMHWRNTRATVFYTTGTTGDPKGVTYSHRQLVLHTLAVSAGLGTVPGTSNTGEIQGQYINLSCTFHQVTTSFPNTATRPENATPLGTLPSPPSNPFTSITTPIYNFPYGWIQDGLEVETINGAGATIYLVKQSMVYIYSVMPG